MKKRCAFIGAILSLIPFGQPLVIKTGMVLSTTGLIISVHEKAYANTADYYIKSGNKKFNQGDVYGALFDYSKAIEIDPEDYNAINNRGLIKNELKDYEGAIADFIKVIEMNPKDDFAYNNRGNSKFYLKDYEGAIADYTKAIEINPKYLNAYNNRGNSKYYLKDYEGAIADYTKAIEINPKYLNAINNRGNSKLELKNYEGAIADYTNAIEINPENSTAYAYRGMAKEMFEKRNFFRHLIFIFNGDLKGACDDWEKASELGYEEATNWVKDRC